MERLVAISCDEYIALGDSGAWVYGHWQEYDHPNPDQLPDNRRVTLWEQEKRCAKNGTYTAFYTKVSDDEAVS